MQSKVGFIKGMNMDSSISKRDLNSYYRALNARILTDTGLSSGSLVNEKGNKLLFRLPTTLLPVYTLTFDSTFNAQITINGNLVVLMGTTALRAYNQIIATPAVATDISNSLYGIHFKNNQIVITGYGTLSGVSSVSGTGVTITQTMETLANPKIVGIGTMREWIIIFTTSATNSDNGQIWKCKYDKLTNLIENLSGEYLTPESHLVYNNALGFNMNYRIGEIISRYQDSSNGKIFFIDGLNELRHINVLDSNSLAIPLSSLSAIPDITYGNVKVTKTITGGSYNSGTLQYSYQLFNSGGAESYFAPASGIIHLTESNDYAANTSEYKGTAAEQPTGKAVKVTVDNIDINFDFIRLIAIYYTSQEAQPEIYIVDEKQIPSSGEVEFIDDGNPIGTYTPSQYNVSGTTLFIPGTICTKNNYLIAANLQEKYFDIDEYNGSYWDARAYRWNQAGTEFYVDGNAETNLSSIAEEADCVLERSDQLTYRYNSNTGNFGGLGTNIQYEFFLKQIRIDQSTTDGSNDTPLAAGSQNWSALIDSTYQDNDSYTSYASPINRSQLVGYTRDEIYRFGIVFFDAKGRQSFVKWIGDIKMPSLHEEEDGILSGIKTTYTLPDATPKYDYGTTFEDTIGGGTYANVLGVSFAVYNIPAGLKYRIVRVRREDSDKYILGQGLMGCSIIDGDDYLRVVNHIAEGSGASLSDTTTTYNDVGTDKYLITFKSPEVLFNNSILPVENDQVEVVGLVSNIGYSTHYSTDTTGTYEVWVNKLVEAAPEITGTPEVAVVKDGIKVEDTYLTDTDNGFRYVIQNGGTRTRFLNHQNAFKGSCLAIGLDDTLTLASGSDLVILNYMKSPTHIQYGGNTFTDRINNVYISCGNVTDQTLSYVFGGDTYICMWEYLNAMMWTNHSDYTLANSEKMEVLYIPLETTINTELRHGSAFSRGQDTHKLCESQAFGNSVYPGVDNVWGVYPMDLEDVYQYNSAYSVEPIGKSYTVKPLIFNNNKVNDYRVISSEQHINGQVSDSWTKFYQDNILEVNSAYGKIVKLITSRSQVIFFQENAFGLISFSERQLLKDDTGSSLVLGIGDILENYRYISEKTGTKSKFGVVDTGNAVYFMDLNNRKFMRFNGQSDESLSDIHSMSSYFRSASYYDALTTDATSNKKGIHGVYDPVNKRVLYTILTTGGTNETFSFNEVLGSFESFYSFLPTIYESTDFGIISVEPTNKQSCYVHDQGYRGVFYGTAYPTYVTATFAPNPDYKKVFTNLEFNSIVEYDILGTIEEIPTETISTIRLWNSFQDTGDLLVSHPTSLRRRFRTWRYQIPRRNSLRLMDYGLFTTMTFTNSLTDDKYFKLDDITIHYLFPMI